MALLCSIVSGLVLAAVSFIVSFFLKRFAIEKKIFVMLGTTAIFFRCRLDGGLGLFGQGDIFRHDI